MKGTFISILVGALAGVLLTIGSNVHASHSAASRAAQAGSGIVARPELVPEAAAAPAAAPATPIEQAPLPK